MMKTFFVICDGLGDRPIPKLGRKTPLEYAKTPNLDAIARRGIIGAMNTIDIGVRPGSDTAHMAIFGYDPHVYYTGRGPFETAGLRMEHKDGDICFRVNMGTVDDTLHIIDRRAGRIGDTSAFARELNGMKIDGVEFFVKAGTGYRMGMIMRGKKLSTHITDIDPGHVGKGVRMCEATDDTSEAKRTAKILNTFVSRAHKLLKRMPVNIDRQKNGLPQANYLLVRGAGVYPKLPRFFDKYGLRAACFAGAGLYKGIARLIGMDVVHVPGATGKPDSNIRAKVETAIKHRKDYDFFFIHFKGADSCGEDGDVEGKIAYIEKIDDAVAPLLKLKNSLVVITADHSTPCTIKSHSADDVPIVIMGDEVRDDDVHEFSERTCAKGRMGHIKGMHVMPIILDLMGIAEKFGA